MCVYARIRDSTVGLVFGLCFMLDFITLGPVWSASNVDITIHLDTPLWHGTNWKKVHDIWITGNQIVQYFFFRECQ